MASSAKGIAFWRKMEDRWARATQTVWRLPLSCAPWLGVCGVAAVPVGENGISRLKTGMRTAKENGAA